MIFLALICVSLVGLLAYVFHYEQSKEREWMQERHSLLNRIQRPEYVQPPLMQDLPSKDEVEQDLQTIATEPTDDIDLVGTVQTFNADDD